MYMFSAKQYTTEGLLLIHFYRSLAYLSNIDHNDLDYMVAMPHSNITQDPGLGFLSVGSFQHQLVDSIYCRIYCIALQEVTSHNKVVL